MTECDRHGWDHVRGCFVDRLSATGGFPAIDTGLPLPRQFPLGAFLTYPILNGDPRKVVLVRGAVYVVRGQHYSFSPLACPPSRHFIPVHHYKWTQGIPERLAARIVQLRQEGAPYWTECRRFLDCIHSSGGRIDLSGPRLLVAPCTPSHRKWDALKALILPYC
ncbi:MAG: hypothetical protein JNK48_23535 [Bryobacterales bacterium]|nr:hypothetical protein [Bryobacterales bacterium]